jgi:aspartate ammonia-lyase
MFRDLLQNERYLTNAIDTLVRNCLADLTVNVAQCEKNVHHSAVSATVLNPYLGYVETTALVKEALAKGVSVQTLLKAKKLLDPDLVERLFSPAVMTNQVPTTQSRFETQR